jgi:phage gp36-like protein
MGSPLLTISSASLAADGKTATITITGGVGSLTPSSGITGISINADGTNIAESTVTASAFTVTIVLSQLVSFASLVTVSIQGSPQSNLQDSSGNTPIAGSVAVINNSTVNTYIQTTQFLQRYDRRTALQLSGDDNARQGNLVNLQEVLNDASGELESGLDGRYLISQVRYILPMPRVLTRWVGIKAREALYSRRTSKPRGVQADSEWAEKWMLQIISGEVNIPSVGRQITISNVCPPQTEFDCIFNPLVGPVPYW